MEALTEKGKKFIMVAVFALAAFLILFHFTETPVVWLDDGVFTEAARNFAFSGQLALQTAPGKFFPLHNLLSVGYPVFLPVSGSLLFFGPGVWQARLPMVVYMFALVVLFYLFAKRRYGFSAALVSVLLLISFPPFYGNGRPVFGEVPGLVFIVLGSLFALIWEEDSFRSKEMALFSALAFGFAAACKPLYLIILSAALFATLLLCYRRFQDKKILFIFAGGYMLPVIVWLLVTFPSVGAMVKGFTTYLFLSGNHGSSVSTAQTLITNLLRFFKESTPILFLLLFVTTALSFVQRCAQKGIRDLRVAECIIFCFIILNFAAYLKGTGWYRYFFPAHLLLYLLFPAAFFAIASAVSRPAFKKFIFGIPVILIGIQFFLLVFHSVTALTVRNTGNSELAQILNNVEPPQKVLFYNAVEATIFLKGNNYSQYLAEENFLVAGDSTALNDPTADIIVTARSRDEHFSLLCYEHTSVSRYELFRKIKDCKK